MRPLLPGLRTHPVADPKHVEHFVDNALDVVEQGAAGPPLQAPNSSGSDEGNPSRRLTYSRTAALRNRSIGMT